MARSPSVKDKPWGASRSEWEEMLREWEAHWGEGILLRANAPSVADDPVATLVFGTLERASASPGSIVALMRANYEMDVRHILPAIAIPTLVMHRTGDVLVPVAAGRYLAEHIPGAKYVEMPGTDHSITDSDTQNVIADEIEKFTTGDLHRPEPDRVLTTVVFADIKESSPSESQVEKPESRELLRHSHEVLRAELESFSGPEQKTTFDGLMATFNGPARAIRFACSARERVRRMGLQIRAGLHTGECELVADQVRGIAVDIAARVTSLAHPDEVLLSSTVKDLVAGSKIQFVDRGIHTLEAVHGEWHLFKVAG